MIFNLLKNFNNKSTDWLAERLKTPEYRGQHLVQHYRFDFYTIYKILECVDEYAPNQSLLAIRTSDLSAKPIDLPEWKNYSLLCNKIKDILGKTTQDTLRKITFVDLERLGFIHRYDKNKKLNKPYEIHRHAYVSISNVGLELLKCKNDLERSFLIGKCVDIFLNNCISNLLHILRSEIKYIDIYEYMFFVTAIDFEGSFILTRDEAMKYIMEYRKLASSQRKALIQELSKNMVPTEGDIKGFDRKDFHNWKNETQSLFNNFLKNIIYFNLEGTKNIQIVLSNKDGLFTDEQTRLDRSSQERQLYMKEHKINKKEGFELHHILPLAYSTSLEHFKLLDKWQNLIYIDAYSHRKIKQHIILEAGDEQNLKLLNYSKEEICLADKVNVLYGYDKKQIMLDYNKKLRETT